VLGKERKLDCLLKRDSAEQPCLDNDLGSNRKVINLSSHELTKEESSILNKSIIFDIAPSNDDKESIRLNVIMKYFHSSVFVSTLSPHPLNCFSHTYMVLFSFFSLSIFALMTDPLSHLKGRHSTMITVENLNSQSTLLFLSLQNYLPSWLASSP